MDHLDVMEYVSELEPIWTERYWRLFRIYKDKTVPYTYKTRHLHTVQQAMILAYQDLKRWKDTGEL